VAIGRDEFLARLAIEFPEVIASFNEYDKGLLHCEIATFRRATERAIDTGRLWVAEKHFRFVQATLKDSNSELRNALEVSYLEDFALGEFTPERYRAVKARMPKSLRLIIERSHPNWK
jgi:hypothetical protein